MRRGLLPWCCSSSECAAREISCPNAEKWHDDALGDAAAAHRRAAGHHQQPVERVLQSRYSLHNPEWLLEGGEYDEGYDNQSSAACISYARGDMVALIKFVHVPFMITGSKGFTAFTRGDEALEWYTKLYEAAVKQGYAKSHGSTWG